MTEVTPEEDVPFGYVRLDDGTIVSKDELCPGCFAHVGPPDEFPDFDGICPYCGEEL